MPSSVCISIAIIGLLADRGIHIVVTVTMVVPGSSDKYTILCFASFKASLAFFLLLEFDLFDSRFWPTLVFTGRMPLTPAFSLSSSPLRRTQMHMQTSLTTPFSLSSMLAFVQTSLIPEWTLLFCWLSIPTNFCLSLHIKREHKV